MVVVEGFLLAFDFVTVAMEPVQTWVRRLDWKVVEGFLQEFDSVSSLSTVREDSSICTSFLVEILDAFMYVKS